MPSDVNKRDILASGLFDGEWYQDQYGDVQLLGMDPLEHYIWLGHRLGRNPGPQFDSNRYVQEHSDVSRAGYNPVLHYIRYGKKEGRKAYPVKTLKQDKPATPSLLGVTAKRTAGAVAHRADRPTILLCAHSAGRELFGSERSFLDMLLALETLQYNVVVTVPSKGNRAYFEAILDMCSAVYVFGYDWWRHTKPLNNASVAEFAGIIVTEKIDAVYANTIVLREPLIAARRLGVRSIVHIRELIHRDEALLKIIGEDAETIVDTIWDHVDVAIANSHATLRGFKTDTQDPALVYNTCDMDDLRALPAPQDKGPIRIGLISSNLPKKGILDFVKIAQACTAPATDLRFCLIGPETDYTRNVEKKIEAGELPNNIEILGYRTSPADAVAETDLMLSISNFDESFGRTVLEAMAAGRPAIVYDRGAPPEIVEDGVSGYVVPDADVKAVAAKIDHLAAHRETLVEMGQAAAIRAEKVFGWDAYVAQMKQAFDTLFDRAPAPPSKLVLRPQRDMTPKPRSGLKIAYFCWHFPVPSETFVLNELRRLRAAGHDVLVFCKQSPYPDFKPDFDITWERIKDVDHLARRLVETGRTIVHSHFAYPTVTDMVWPACEKAKVHFTFIPHAQDIFRYRNDVSNRIGEVSQSAYCLKVFVPSRFHQDYLEARGVPPHKMAINANGCDHALYSKGWVSNRAERPFRRITAIHRFTEKKGLIHLIRAAKLLAQDGIQIDLYGYGELEDSYREVVAEEGITNVGFCGPVKNRDEMLEVFRKSDLFACPSVRAADGDMDGIPTVLMEAMAAGLPVITTDLSGIPDLVDDGVTGIVAKPTADGLAARIRDYYALPDVAVGTIIDSASEKIRKNYDSDQLVEWLLRVWNQETVDLMIVSWNNLAQTSEVIRRLYKYTSLPFHLIVCDNGSDPKALAHLLAVHGRNDNVTLILNRENAFVGPGTNICLEAGQSDYAIYVCGKEGMTTNYGWEKPFIRYMDTHPKVGQAGTLCYSPSYLYGRDYPKAQALWDKFRNRQFAMDNPDRKFSHVQGGFFALRREMIDKIGGFSDDVPHNSTDVEFSYYVESCGWELGTIPGLMALFNKTRPGLFQRVDEQHAALHPPMLTDLPALDRIAKQRGRHCNACGQTSPAFDGGFEMATCPRCGSTRRARSIHRVLAESMLLYRRLPALGVNVPKSITPFWIEQFQGQVHDVARFTQTMRTDGRTDFSNERLDLVLLNDMLGPVAAQQGLTVKGILDEAARIIKTNGTLIVSGKADIDTLNTHLGNHGFVLTSENRYSSVVSQYDWVPVLFYTKEI